MRVPIYERREGISPLQGGNVSPVMPAGDNGTNAAGVVKGLALRLQQMQDDTEDARTLELFNKFKNDSMEYHENPDKGIYNTRLGYQSQGVFSEADEWLRQRGESYVNQLRGERSKANFRRMARDYIVQRGTQNSRFEAEQWKKYINEQSDATIKNWLTDVEANWDNPETLKRAREGIQQALELKMRGSSKEAFTEAWNGIENQIGVSRIRQAYVKDPLLAVRMLADPDIKLNPKTKAELIKSLGDKTEVYELQGIAQTYNRLYSQENSVQAYNDLIRRYGADKGQKAFSALSHIWNIENNQEHARAQVLIKLQHENELTLYTAFNDPNVTNPTQEELDTFLKNKTISAQAHRTFSNHIKALETDEQKAKQAQEKLQHERNNIKLKIDALNNRFASDEILNTGIENGTWSFEAAEYHRNKRNKYIADAEKEKQNQEKKRLSDNSDTYLKRINIGDYPTREELIAAQNNNDLDPNAVSSFLKIVEAHEANDTKSEQKATARAIDVMLNSGGSITREEVSQLVEENKISDTDARRFWNWVDADKAKKEAQSARDEAKKKKEQEEQAKHNKLTELDKLAKQIVHGSENKSSMLNYIEGLDLSVEDKDLLLKRAEKHWDAKEQTAKDKQAANKEMHENLFSTLMLSAKMGDFETPEKMLELFAAKAITKNEYDEYESERAKFSAAQQKAEQEAQDDRLRDMADDLASRFPLGHQEGAYSEIREMELNGKDKDMLRTYYNRIMQEQQVVQTNEEKAKAEQQKKNFQNLNDTYWSKGQSVDNKILVQLAKDDSLSSEQLDRAYSMNAALNTRAGHEEALMKDPDLNFSSLSRNEQEAMIMLRMGTTQEDRKKNVAYLFQRLLNGTLPDTMLDWYYAHGRIAPDDRENLKNYNSKLGQQEKEIIQQKARELTNEIRDVLRYSPDRTTYENNAIIDFERATFNLIGLSPKDFDRELSAAYERIKANTIAIIEEKKETNGFLWGRNNLGKRIDEWGNSEVYIPSITTQIPFETTDGIGTITPEGQTAETYSNVPPVIEPPAPPVSSPDVKHEEVPQYVPQPYVPLHERKQMSRKEQATQNKISQFDDIINASADQNGVDPELVKAVIHVESGGNPNAVSNVGAEGLMQLMPDTAKGLGVANSFDIAQNIMGGTKYIAQQLARYTGNVKKALWAYNAGPGKVDKGILPKKTKKYIQKVMRIYNILKEQNSKNQPAQTYEFNGIDLGGVFSSQPRNVPTIRSSDEEVFANMRNIFADFVSKDEFWNVLTGKTSNDYGYGY